MVDKEKDVMGALKSVYAALKNLDANDRKRVLSSAHALLGSEARQIEPMLPSTGASQQGSVAPQKLQGTPVSIVELVLEKSPSTNAQRIATFAYYREKYLGLSRFSRADLKTYFSKAKLSPGRNYDRDFGDAARKGWIHEDGTDSYLTTKGIEAIEKGFESSSVERPSAKKRIPKTQKKIRKKKMARKARR